MKSLILALSVAVASVGLMPEPAEAKRFGGGGLSGMKRQTPPRSTPDATPAKPAQATPAGAAATPPKRNWMGPIAGLAAGLGLAALMSHLGLGDELANFMMMALLALGAFFVIRLLMRRFAPGSGAGQMATPQGMKFTGLPAGGASTPAGAAAAAGAGPAGAPAAASWGSGAVAPSQSAAASFAATPTLPAGFDSAAFERVAKMIFIRMQAANDTADLNDLRNFTTPEMFAQVRLELQDRGTAMQQTDVQSVEAKIIDFASEAAQQIVSVRFHGMIQEERDQPAAAFDEIWHLVRPTDGSREWAIAGIQQSE